MIEATQPESGSQLFNLFGVTKILPRLHIEVEAHHLPGRQKNHPRYVDFTEEKYGYGYGDMDMDIDMDIDMV